jgi:hypothetical protein
MVRLVAFKRWPAGSIFRFDHSWRGPGLDVGDLNQLEDAERVCSGPQTLALLGQLCPIRL